jgi:acetoin utilization protein AcuB
MSTVLEFMTPSPYTIGDDQSLSRAHELMREHRIRHLPVLHGGKLVGVVSLGDLHLLETLGRFDLTGATVDEAMTPDPYVVTPDTPLQEVAAEMAEHKYGTAIVARGQRVVGIFTTTDALRALTKRAS